MSDQLDNSAGAGEGAHDVSARRDLGGLSAIRMVGDLALDSLLAVIAAWVAVALRYDRVLPVETFRSILPWVLLPALVMPVTAMVTGTSSISWRRPAIHDAVDLAVSTSIALGTELIIFYGVLTPLGVPGTVGFPRSYWPLQAGLWAALAAAFRFRPEWLRNPLPKAPTNVRTPRTRVLLFGAGAAGTAVAQEISSNPSLGLEVVGFLDDDPRLRSQRIRGVPVLGNSLDMARAVARVQPVELLITMPSAPGQAVRRIVEAARAAGLPARTIPSIAEIVSTPYRALPARAVKMEDLLRRPVSMQEEQRVRSLVHGRRVLVTGAAGSIGAEIMRQAVKAEPALLVAFDQAESPLYEMERDVTDRIGRADGPATSLVTALGSVSDAARLRDLFSRYPVDIVVHAAAYKHVPMLEGHPAEAVVTNLGGTLALLEQAQASRVRVFILISTDKAVQPTSVMGATKRLAELAVVAAGRAFDWDAVVVRFGNVLGSAGSVVPIFEAQLARGAAITITDPDATRFFMTIPEASQLVLNAGALGGHGTIYVLKMGAPVRIVDLAHDLIRLAGLDDAAVPIQFVGLRPGERLHETLLYDLERAEETADPGILRVSTPTPDASVTDQLRDLVERAQRRQVTGEQVLALARELGNGTI